MSLYSTVFTRENGKIFVMQPKGCIKERGMKVTEKEKNTRKRPKKKGQQEGDKDRKEDGV